jgi:hypothetical protein
MYHVAPEIEVEKYVELLLQHTIVSNSYQTLMSSCSGAILALPDLKRVHTSD